jgi:hypothetical protein
MAKKSTGAASGFDLEEMWRAFGSMAPDWTKALKDAPMPGQLWQDLVRTQQRNVETVTKLNEAAAAAMRQVGERQLELVRAIMSESAKISEAMRKPGGAAAGGSEAMSAAFERALVAMRDIAEIAEKANRAALAEITARSEAFQVELREMLEKAKPGGA